jgi:GAF domain-containing protein
MSEPECLRAILGLSRLPTLEGILDEVLRVLLERTRMAFGYAEVLNEQAEGELSLWRARARSPEHVTWIQEVISRGIIAHARIEGRTLMTRSAIDDARFADFGSVRAHEIGEVACAPFDGFWTSGVIYLQGSAGAANAPADTPELIEVAARQVGVLAELHRWDLAPRLPLAVELDAVKRHLVEDALRRHDWNISAVARETGLGRATIRALMRNRRHR